MEYALILSLIALAVVGAVTLFGESLEDYYQHIVDSWP
jgi:Flp pilus assembly pilin Flp